MILPPVVPIMFLVLGALAVGASDLAHLRRPSLVMAVASLLALVAAYTLRNPIAVTQIVSGWQPVSVFTVPLSFRVDQTAWVIGIGFLLTCLAVAFTWLAFPGQHRPAPRALALLLIATALVSTFASNLLALAVAWGLLDTVFVVALLLRSGPQVSRRAAIAIILNTTATICVWIATLLIENGHESLYWHLMSLSETPRAWLVAAAVLRIGLYPLHQWLPVELGKEPDRSVLLFTVPPAVGLALWARLAVTHNLPTDSIVPLLAVASAIVGGVLAWSSIHARYGLPFIALALSGLAIVVVNATPVSGLLTVATLNWLFIIVSLFIARRFNRRAPWWSAGVLLAGLSLVGIPGTLGFAVRQQMITRLVLSGNWLLLSGSIVGEILLVAATIRLIMARVNEDEPIHPLRQIGYGFSIGCAALPLIGLAVVPGLIPGVPSLQELLAGMDAVSWVAWFVPIAAGVVIAVRDRRPEPTAVAAPSPIWRRALQLDWLVALLSLFVQRLTAVVRGLATVIEGEGGLIWAMIVVIIGLVLTSGALK
jgi:NADH:ubiquinone oxidoreductase subunit 2 (subunit N)